MCIAYPARILALDAGSAVVDMAGRTRRASLLMTPDVEVGAWVLVAAGTVIRRIDAAEALDLASQLDAAMAARRASTARPFRNAQRVRRSVMTPQSSPIRIPQTLRWGVVLAVGTAAISGCRSS